MVFFAQQERAYESIGYNGGSFQGCINLRYFEMPDGITSIGPYAFSGCSMMFGQEYTEDDIKNFFKNIETIENRAFVSNGGDGKTFYFPGRLRYIQERAFYYAGITKAIFGGKGDPSRLTPAEITMSPGYGIFDNSDLTTVHIYSEDPTAEKWNEMRNLIGTLAVALDW